MTIVEFLEARFAEDEEVTRQMGGRYHWFPDVGVHGGVVLYGNRVRDEVAAKRAILAGAWWPDVNDGYYAPEAVERIAVILASVYRDHPDFDSAWAPGA